MGKGGSILIPLNYQNHLGSGYHQACLADKETEAPKGGVSSRECISLVAELGWKARSHGSKVHTFNSPSCLSVWQEDKPCTQIAVIRGRK